MLICTWTVQHLNLPAQSPDSLTGSSKLRRTLKRAWTRVKWMVITLIAPEFLAGKAFQDFMMARKSRNQMRKFVGTDCVSWSLAHAYYANMGGFILKVDPEALINAEEASSQVCQCQSITATKSTVDGSEVSEGLNDNTARQLQEPQLLPQSLLTVTVDEKKEHRAPSAVCEEVAPPLIASSSNPKTHINEISTSDTTLENIGYAYPSADQLYALREMMVITSLPDVSVREIEDKSKGDAFVKGTTVLQVLWLIIQVIVRGARDMPVSQLEISVIAFTACALLTYSFSWSKPQNVTVANLASDSIISREVMKALEDKTNGASWSQNLFLGRDADIFKPIPNDAEFDCLPSSKFLTLLDLGIVIAGTIFGAVHLIAWNFHFPTPLEGLLWKLASVYLAATLPFCYINAYIFEKLGWLEGTFENSGGLSKNMVLLGKFVVSLPIISYVLARLCLMVLIFRCLFFLDPKTFITTWAKEVPHVR
ncbi:hypothetical protein GLAREA_07733 [Glarea lozoyensis ATCC 20868]|uniref:Uncharacterized protein n=1 Tax=Glarea lozoyensis (strain ATCC 20868 / MF5171) TaxID=1116229 RepID=S3D639_GLAL2|nr:uncharacterized protein GLAREA_07733 [Glarea lozoyensis ATCC 20868]EPE32599.1 hypothetical protein GLAREA_07733 [Glarea lozoyensis ATCC 20868]